MPKTLSKLKWQNDVFDWSIKDDIVKALLTGIVTQLGRDFSAEVINFTDSEFDAAHQGVMIEALGVPDRCVVFVDDGYIVVCFVDDDPHSDEPDYLPYRAYNFGGSLILTVSMADPKSINKVCESINVYVRECFKEWWKRVKTSYPKNSPLFKYIKETINEPQRQSLQSMS